MRATCSWPGKAAGRDLNCRRGGRTVELTRWAREELERVRDVAALLDEDREDYVDAVDAQLAAIDDSGLTPAAQILPPPERRGGELLRTGAGNVPKSSRTISMRYGSRRRSGHGWNRSRRSRWCSRNAWKRSPGNHSRTI